MATGVELAMESARVRHTVALDRPTAVHLFSDYLPFHRELRAWLIQRKLDRDFEPLAWLHEASLEDLRARFGDPTAGERRGEGLYVGDVPRAFLDDDETTDECLARLAPVYAGLEDRFVAPYVDLV
jgi:hypothetical protein